MTKPDWKHVFESLADSHVKATRYLSSTSAIQEDAAFKGIVEVGAPMIPHLFERLARDSSWSWILALNAILQEGPDVPSEVWGDILTVQTFWLVWGRQEGLYKPSLEGG